MTHSYKATFFLLQKGVVYNCSTMYIHSILSGFSSTFCYQEPYTLECKGNSQPLYCGLVRVMAFNAIFNNISVILWWSVLLMEETGVPRENHRPVASRWQTLSHNVVSSTPRLGGIRTHNISGDGHWLHTQLKTTIEITITTMMDPIIKWTSDA